MNKEIKRSVINGKILPLVKASTEELDEMDLLFDKLPERVSAYHDIRSDLIKSIRKESLENNFLNVTLDFAETVFPHIDEIFLSIKNHPTNAWSKLGSVTEGLKSSLEEFEQSHLEIKDDPIYKENITVLRRLASSKSDEETKKIIKEHKEKEKKLISGKKNPFILLSFNEEFINDQEVVVPMAYLLYPNGSEFKEKDPDIFYFYSLLRAGDAVSWFEPALAVDGGGLVFINEAIENYQENIVLAQQLFKDLGISMEEKDLKELFLYFTGAHELGHSKHYNPAWIKNYKEKDFWTEFLADSFMIEKVIDKLLLSDDIGKRKKMLGALASFLAIVIPEDRNGILEEEVINDDDHVRKQYNSSRLRILRILYRSGILSIGVDSEIKINANDMNIADFRKKLSKYIRNPLLQDPSIDENGRILILMNKFRIKP